MKAAISPDVAAKSDSLIKGWSSSGMWLPDEGQVHFFRSHFEQTQQKLETAISSDNEDVRRNATYVVAELKADARACGPKLLAQLKKEPERLVRMYLYDALAATAFGSPEVIVELKRRYDSLSTENTPREPSYEYTEVDERIDLAATLYVLDTGPDQKNYLGFVQQWLHPPGTDLTRQQLTGYWERRWIAVASSERMMGAKSSIPLLEAMLKEPDAEPWVSTHVPRVLKALR